VETSEYGRVSSRRGITVRLLVLALEETSLGATLLGYGSARRVWAEDKVVTNMVN
jgi:hypothetical protein